MKRLCVKNKHPTKDDALRAMRKTEQQSASISTVWIGNVYRCDSCRAWHWGRRRWRVKNINIPGADEANYELVCLLEEI